MYETPNKALEALVVTLGGSKQVAPKIWPDKGVEEARRLLCDCLNDERPAKLDFSQVLFLLKLARDKGIHSGMEYVDAYLGYAQPVPIEPADEMGELQRQFIEAQKAMAAMVDRMERISSLPKLRAA